ncbi:Kiwa anti-phage protein KwaB-like domain-containing protein [Sporolactobacillus vineae]|uniref:Kiwa anti-phage protein KwaB-like domain-containing protein n=2 Tax=Sporolactobacillus vineae TaxID=444463 RepID=UPI00037CBD22|nr:Kiwa anti-phage protein KwaB-like domain-containing protein [Sporolactobacillus vineae]
MDIDLIKHEIGQLNQPFENRIKLFFVEKESGNYCTYYPEINDSVRESINDLVKNSLSLRLFTFKQVEYNPSITEDDTLQVSPIDGLADIPDIIDKINYENAEKDLSELVPDKITFYVIEYVLKKDSLLIFRRINKMRKIREAGFIGQMFGNQFVKIENDFFGLDGTFDILIFNGEALIINRIALERIFNMKDYFSEKTNQAMAIIKEQNRISHFEQFKEDCLSDARITKKITKLVNTKDQLPKFFNNFSGIQTVIAEFDLDINLDEKGKINYDGSKSELFEITNLMSDAYYESLLFKRKGVDPS